MKNKNKETTVTSEQFQNTDNINVQDNIKCPVCTNRDEPTAYTWLSAKKIFTLLMLAPLQLKKVMAKDAFAKNVKYLAMQMKF